MEARVTFIDGSIECVRLPAYEPPTVSVYDADMKKEISSTADDNTESIREFFGKNARGDYILERYVMFNTDDKPVPNSPIKEPVKSCIVAYYEELPDIKSIAVDDEIVYGEEDEAAIV